jgi:hypothetical protein
MEAIGSSETSVVKELTGVILEKKTLYNHLCENEESN